MGEEAAGEEAASEEAAGDVAAGEVAAEEVAGVTVTVTVNVSSLAKRVLYSVVVDLTSPTRVTY